MNDTLSFSPSSESKSTFYDYNFICEAVAYGQTPVLTTAQGRELVKAITDRTFDMTMWTVRQFLLELSHGVWYDKTNDLFIVKFSTFSGCISLYNVTSAVIEKGSYTCKTSGIKKTDISLKAANGQEAIIRTSEVYHV